MKHKVITLSRENYDVFEKLKLERERELGTELSWDQFVGVVLKQIATKYRDGAGGRADRVAPRRAE